MLTEMLTYQGFEPWVSPQATLRSLTREGKVRSTQVIQPVAFGHPGAQQRHMVQVGDDVTTSGFGSLAGSFRKIIESGQIKMTPYHKKRLTVSKEIQVLRRSQPFGVYYSVANEDGSESTPVAAHGLSTRVQNVHFDVLPKKYIDAGVISDLGLRINDAISDTQLAVWEKSLKQFDLATFIGELPEAIKYGLSKVAGGATALSRFARSNPGYRRVRGLNARQMLRSSDRSIRALGGRWLEYRYAIMPLILSAQDAAKLMRKSAARYVTERSRKDIAIAYEPIPFDGEGLYVRRSGNVLIRSTCKAMFKGANHNLLARTGINPFVMAWELVPMSFVVDWFINIGDYIFAHTAVDFASSRSAVTSVKTNETKETIYRVQDQFPGSVKNTNWGPRTVHPPYEMTHEVVVMREVLEEYLRFTWTRPEVDLSIEARLNWMRIVDAIALGYSPTVKLLRSL